MLQKRANLYVLVSVERSELCDRFGYPCFWEELAISRQALRSGTLESPTKKQAVGRLAEVGGECWFSSIYYLLVGRKSGEIKYLNFKQLLKKVQDKYETNVVI